MTEYERQTKLEYFPLSMYKLDPMNMKDQTYDLRNHVGKVKHRKVRKRDDLMLPENSLLRQGKENKPKVLYCVTMYNEPFSQLLQSLAGVYRSYYELVEIDESFKDRCHIMIIADGYDRLDEAFLMRCEKAGIFNEFKTKRFRTVEAKPGAEKPEHVFKELLFINTETMNDRVRTYGTNNILHTFSRSVKYPELLNGLDNTEADNFNIDKYSVYNFLLGSSKRRMIKHKKYFHLPMPIHFGIKHRNQGKIESHKWFFKGFCQYMDPKYAQIIDCGSIALWNSISHIVMHMEAHPQVGGACGEIECLIPEKKEDGSGVTFIESIVLRAQYLEYKISHYLDKATESLFGFVSVLPGAFSTFRWECIRGKPLDTFLKGAQDEFGDITKIRPCFEANKYLAEDRIMCLEIIAKRHNNYIIHYVPGAKCLTDPPFKLTDLIKQRRRWFNGSMFATIHVLKHMCRVWGRSRCSCIRNFFFMILYLYLIIQMILSYIIVGSFYGVFSVFLRAVLPSDDCLSITSPANIIENVYLVFLFLTLLLSTTVEIQWAETGYRICSIVMGVFTLFMVVCSIFFIMDATITSIGILLFGVYVLSYGAPLIMNCGSLRICDFIKGVIYAIYLSPTYVNIFTIYAISNIHDVSWGNRPTVANGIFAKVEKTKMMLYKNYRSRFLIIWVAINIIVGYGFIYLYREGYLDIVFYIGAFLVLIMFIRIVLSTLHKCKARCDRIRTNWTVFRRKSSVFKNVGEFMVKDKREIFAVFYDEADEDLRISRKDDPAYKKATIRSSVKDQYVYRGFNLPEINYIHRISQGYMDGRISKTSFKMHRKSTGRFINESIEESDEEDSSSIEDPVYSPKAHNPKKQHTIDKDGKSRKVNFAEDVKENDSDGKEKFEDNYDDQESSNNDSEGEEDVSSSGSDTAPRQDTQERVITVNSSSKR